MRGIFGSPAETHIDGEYYVKLGHYGGTCPSMCQEPEVRIPFQPGSVPDGGRCRGHSSLLT